MELYLEAVCEPAVVARREGRSSEVQPGTPQVIGPLRLGAFASTGSLLGLKYVEPFPGSMTNPG